MKEIARRDGEPDIVPDHDVRSELEMEPELMLDLARRSAELLVDRIRGLPEENAWDGDFRRSLETQLLEEPPEEGRAPAEVIERVSREVLPYAARHDHPRFLAFVPSSPTWPGILADFIAAGYNFNVCTWLAASGPSQLELVVIDWFSTGSGAGSVIRIAPGGFSRAAVRRPPWTPLSRPGRKRATRHGQPCT